MAWIYTYYCHVCKYTFNSGQGALCSCPECGRPIQKINSEQH